LPATLSNKKDLAAIGAEAREFPSDQYRGEFDIAESQKVGHP